MRVLHLVKTSDGANWAADQAVELSKLGVEVHVALPSLHGSKVSVWAEAGATLHELPLNFPIHSPWKLPGILRSVRELVARVKPDLSHSHFVGTTLLIRMALGKHHSIPRIFQVPGPLHLEHAIYRTWELSSSGENDYWIGTSRAICNRYRDNGIGAERLFLSYCGTKHEGRLVGRSGALRTRLGIAPDQWVVGNINLMYPPKYYLGQPVGIKCHEDVIDALQLVIKSRSDVVGILLGGQWGGRNGYEQRLRARAQRLGQGRIYMPGFIPSAEVSGAWSDYDLAVHVPLSENCGGVVDPYRAGVPVIASRVGGLPDVVMEGLTGVMVSARKPAELATAIINALDHYSLHQEMAARGRELVDTMFNVKRTAAEVYAIYRHILGQGPRPAEFDSKAFVSLSPVAAAPLGR